MKRKTLTIDELETFIREATVSALGDALEPIRKAEMDRQKTQVKDVKGLTSKKNSQGVDEADEGEEETPEEGEDQPDLSSEVPKVTRQKLEKASLKDVVKMLNVLRSGRSLKDPPVQKKLKAYLDGLPPDQRETLYVFLTGLSEIMVEDEPGKVAMKPKELGIKITAPKSKEEEKAPESDLAPPDDEEEGTLETPIVVGEVANKAYLRRIFRKNSRK